MWKSLPLTGDPYSNVEEVELDGVSAALIDGYVNELGHTVKRPGLRLWADLGTEAGVDGLHWWHQQNTPVSVSGGQVFKHTDLTGTKEELTGATMQVGTRPTFITDRSKLYMANGGAMIHTDLSALTTMADAQAPTSVSHLAYLDGYAIANQRNTRDANFSDPTDMTSWAATDTFRKSARPDNLVSIREGWSELLLSGEESTELWVNDGLTPFIRRSNGVLATGCSAPYTVQQVGNHWVWLDDKRRFVRLQSRTPEMISFSYHKVIQSFRSVNDAVSDNIEVSGFPLYVTSFPSGHKTMVYNYQTNGWSEWGYWNAAQGVHEQFRGLSYCYAKIWNKHLVGDRANGLIYELSSQVYTDDENPIRTVRRTGFISHGTDQEKKSTEIIFRLKRGQGNSRVSHPTMMLRWRDHAGAWGKERTLSLGQSGQHELFARITKLGSYRFRQYEISHTDDCEFVLVDAQENIE